jgi:hypothetical protein
MTNLAILYLWEQVESKQINHLELYEADNLYYALPLQTKNKLHVQAFMSPQRYVFNRKTSYTQMTSKF